MSREDQAVVLITHFIDASQIPGEGVADRIDDVLLDGGDIGHRMFDCQEILGGVRVRTQHQFLLGNLVVDVHLAQDAVECRQQLQSKRRRRVFSRRYRVWLGVDQVTELDEAQVFQDGLEIHVSSHAR